MLRGSFGKFSVTSQMDWSTRSYQTIWVCNCN